MLKEIGVRARRDIEAMLGDKIYLELWVKVQKDWRDKTELSAGLRLPPKRLRLISSCAKDTRIAIRKSLGGCLPGSSVFERMRHGDISAI